MERAAKTIKKHSQEIIARWEAKVNEEISASHQANNIVLRDQMPGILDNISEVLQRYAALSVYQSSVEFEEVVENSEDHGRHRASTEAYSIDQVIHEYIVFHRTVTEVLRDNQTYTTEISDLIKYVMETAILKSSVAFNVSIQEMQEKLVGTIAHDLRSPVGTAYGLLEMIRKEQDPEMINKLSQMAQRSLQKSLKLSEGLLDAISTRAGEGMMLEFSENELVQEVRLVHEEATQVYSQEIKLVCTAEEIIGVFDNTAIRRVLENLLTNAIKYGDMNRPITIRLEDESDQVRLSVHNYGNPIPPEKQQYIFEYLKHSEDERETPVQSWGMGLTLIKVIAEAHKGQVLLSSSEEEGTQFTVKFSKHNELGKVRTKNFNNSSKDKTINQYS